jgi:hypothetical protein
MNTKNPLLSVRFEGQAVGAAKIPVDHLMVFLDNITKALRRTGRLLTGDSASVHPGRQPVGVKDEVALDLVLLTHGSPAAVLGFERRQAAVSLPGLDVGQEILEKALGGLAAVQGPADALPAGYDTGVLMAWRDAGTLFSKGISRIEFTLQERTSPLRADFTPAGHERIQQRIKGPETNIRTIEGRLLMADFKEHGTRCRVHPSVGDPVLCLFDEDQKDEVLEDILQYVRIVGEAREDPLTGKISSIKIRDIERLEDRESEDTNLLPTGTPVFGNFWESVTLDELAQAQHVSPLVDVGALFGTWPGDANDGFEAAIDDFRHAFMHRDNQP